MSPLANGSDRGRVLVVDDNAVNQRVLAGILRRAEVDYLTASDGDEAMRAIRRERPDLVLLDIMMPGRDGYSVCEELKSDPEIADTPVIFLSALADSSDKVRGLDLGAADYVTKPFDAREVVARVRTQLRLGRVTREMLAKQRVLEDDLEAAADIQRALIPKRGLALPGLELAWLFEPCSQVGGDVFNVLPLDARHVALYVLDVSGHGVPAAMVAVSASQSLSPTAGLVRSPGGALTAPVDVLRGLDAEYPIGRFDRYFTISFGLLDVISGKLRYSSAAHPPPVVLGREGPPRLLEEGGTLIGLGDPDFEPGEVVLVPGDRLFFYTDGVIEHAHPERGLFGTERLLEVLDQTRGCPLAEVPDSLAAVLDEFGGGVPAADDVSFLAIEYRGGA